MVSNNGLDVDGGTGTRGGGRPVEWDVIVADPRFRSLHRRKQGFLWGLMALAVLYFVCLPIGAGYFPALFKVRLWSVLNVGLLFALSQFAVAWLVALVYARRASRDFDVLAAEIVRSHVPAPRSAVKP